MLLNIGIKKRGLYIVKIYNSFLLYRIKMLQKENVLIERIYKKWKMILKNMDAVY